MFLAGTRAAKRQASTIALSASKLAATPSSEFPRFSRTRVVYLWPPNAAVVIVDEEQRFGAAQKAALNGLAHGLHRLSMTATPIPRTLQTAMIGLRDLSVLLTPPAARTPVRTLVLPYEEGIARHALLHEHRRGGQSFVVCPRVEDIADLRERLGRLVPELSIAVLHGKMPEVRDPTSRHTKDIRMEAKRRLQSARLDERRQPRPRRRRCDARRRPRRCIILIGPTRAHCGNPDQNPRWQCWVNPRMAEIAASGFTILHKPAEVEELRREMARMLGEQQARS